METAEAPPGAGCGATLLAALPLAVSLVALAAVVWWATRQEAPQLPRTGEAAASPPRAPPLRARDLRPRGAMARHRPAGGSRDDARRDLSPDDRRLHGEQRPARPQRGRPPRVPARAPRRDKEASLGTVVAERLLDAVALGLLFAVVAFGLLRASTSPAAGLVLALAGGAAFAARASSRSSWPAEMERSPHPWCRAPARRADPRAREPARRGLLALSVAVWILEASVYLAVDGPRDRAGALDAVYVMALTNLFALVPAAPGYVGTFDAAVVFALGSLDVSGSDALAYLVLLRFVLFVPITIVGLCFLLTRYGGWRLRLARLESTGVS